MAFAFNPITGKLDLVGTGGGSATTDASLLTSGTLALARLDPLVARDDLNNNFTSGQTITAAANTSALTASYSVTGANTTPLLDLSGSWNTTGIARGIRLNVTDTASAAGSLLAEFQRNGTLVASISKTGAYNISAQGIPASSGIGWTGSSHLSLTHNGVTRAVINSLGVTANNSTDLGFNFAASTDAGSSFHSRILSDGAGTVAIRNGGTAGTPVPQNFRVYNYTDAGLTNYERGFMRWNSNVLEIGTEAGGTGTTRSMSFLGGNANFAGRVSTPNGYAIGVNFLFADPLANGFRITDGSGATMSSGGLSIYNVYTNTTNNERGFVRWGSNRFQIGTASLGTGVARSCEVTLTTNASDPTSSDITAGFFAMWKNSTSGALKLWANDGGTMRSVTLS